MVFKVNEFTSNFNAAGYAKQDRFEVRVIPPTGQGSDGSALGRLISGLSLLGGTVGEAAGILNSLGDDIDLFHLALRAESAELPGRAVQTLDNRYYGPLRKSGYQANYVDTTITFLCSEDLREKIFFERWQDLIVGEHRLPAANKNAKAFNAGYYDDYVSTIEIMQLNENNDTTFEMRLLEAYPLQVAPLPLNWASDELHKLSVTFAYNRYESEKKRLPKLFGAISNLAKVRDSRTSTVRRAIRFLDKIF
jgi:hypothetical protein